MTDRPNPAHAPIGTPRAAVVVAVLTADLGVERVAAGRSDGAGR